MVKKISVYVDEDTHRALKVAASARGISLSEFMADAATNALYAPDRRAASARMDLVRESAPGTFSSADIRAMREEGRRT